MMEHPWLTLQENLPIECNSQMLSHLLHLPYNQEQLYSVLFGNTLILIYNVSLHHSLLGIFQVDRDDQDLQP